MPLYLNEKLENGATIGIWHITEELDYFIENTKINQAEKEYLNKFSNEYRKKEFIAVRKLLDTINKDNLLIRYNNEGKPFVDNNINISISHTKDFVTILLCEHYEVGIDIEHTSDRVLKIKNKFLDLTEQGWCKTTEQHIICWSAKESIFKLYGKNVDFKDILILPFELDSYGIINIELKSNDLKKYSINYRKVENNFLTFVFR